MRQTICPYGVEYDITWRTEAFLTEPILYYPRDNAFICLEPTSGNPTQIIFQWSAISGATDYVIEWSVDSSFSDGSSKAAITANTYYVVTSSDAIRKGDTIYWRVFARDGAGGVSPKSRPWKLLFQCPDKDTQERDRNFDVNLQIHGDDYMRCCENKMWSSEISYICKDQFGRELANIASVEWSVSTEGNDGDPEIIRSTDDIAIIQACGSSEANSQIFEITLTVTFNDLVRGDTFNSSVTKKVFLDCHTNAAFQPWMGEGDYKALAVPNEYYDEASLGDLTCATFVEPYEYASYEMACLVGPVFKVPFYDGGCSTLFNFDFGGCCECFPQNLGFTIESYDGGPISSGVLKKTASGTMQFDGRVDSTSGICPTADLTLILQCTGGELSLTGLETCVSSCGGDVCGKEYAKSSLTFIVNEIDCGDSSVLNTHVLSLQEISTDVWQSDFFDICGTGQINYVVMDLSGATPDISVHQFLGSDDQELYFGNFDTLNCGAESFIFNLILDNLDLDCCAEFILSGQLCEPDTPAFLELTPVTFTDCRNPFQTFDIEWRDALDALLATGTITFTQDSGVPCDCSYGNGYLNPELYALEARVNLPVSCGLTFDNGVLSLDLESLLGHGLKIGERDSGCPYIFVDWRAGTQYCCDYGCYCCTYDDLFVCIDGEQRLEFGDGLPTPSDAGGMDGGTVT